MNKKFANSFIKVTIEKGHNIQSGLQFVLAGSLAL